MLRKFLIVLVLGAVLAVTAVAEPIIIRIAGFAVDKPIKEALIRDIIAPAMPEYVEVVFEVVVDDYRKWLLTMLAAGTPPDIFYVDVFWAEEVVGTGLIQPLDDFIAASPVLGIDDLIPVLVEAFTVEERLYAISKDFNSLVVFYNKAMFDAMGVPFPDEEDTWFSFLDKLRRVHNPPYWVGISLNPDAARFLPFAFAAGMPFLDLDGTAPFEGAAAIAAAEFFSAPILLGFGATAADLGVGWPGAAFVEEKAAVVLEGGWLIPPIRDGAPLMEFGVTYYPTIGGQRGNYLFTVGYAMPVEELLPSGRPDLVWRVIELLTSVEAQSFVLELGHAIPSRAELIDHPLLVDPPDLFAEAMKTVFVATGLPGTVPFTFPEVGAVYKITVEEALEAIFMEEMTVEEAMQWAAEQLDKVLMY